MSPPILAYAPGVTPAAEVFDQITDISNGMLVTDLDANNKRIGNLDALGSGIAYVFTPEAHGAAPSLSGTDDTPFVQAAIDAQLASPNSSTVLLSRFYRVSNVVARGAVTIFGTGPAKSGFHTATAAGHVLEIAPAVAPSATPEPTGPVGGINSATISDLAFTSDVTKTSGYALFTRYTHNITIQNVKIGEVESDTAATLPFYDGIALHHAGAFTVRTARINCRHTGLSISGSTVRFFNYDGLVDDVEIWGNQAPDSTGIHIGGGSGGIRVHTGNVVEMTTGIKIDMSIVNLINREYFQEGFFVDSCGNRGVWVAPGSLSRFMMSGGWVSTTGKVDSSPGNAQGILIQEPVFVGFMATISGGIVQLAGGNGIHIEGGDVSICGTSVLLNGNVGIALETPGEVSITGAHVRGNAKGIYSGSGSAHGIVSGNYIANNTVDVDNNSPGLQFWPNYSSGANAPHFVLEDGDDFSSHDAAKWAMFGSPTAGIKLGYSEAEGGQIFCGDPAVALQPLTVLANGVAIPSGSNAEPVALTLEESTHATSRRAQLTLGSVWAMVQDTSANGTRDFGLYSAAAAAFRFIIDLAGNFNLIGGDYYRTGVKVVGARNTGWTAMTGTGSKAALAAAAAGTASAAYDAAELQTALNRIAALEARLKAYDDALTAHGLIGA